MKALRKESRTAGDLKLVNLPVPEPQGQQLLARVAYAGICGSDLDILQNRTGIYIPPVVPGHEFSAVVVQTGAGVQGFRPGDKVVSETTFGNCTECQMCRDGNYHLCTRKAILGWTVNGGFAEYVLLNSQYTHKLAGNADLLTAALVEPAAIAAEAVDVKGRLSAGETVAVIGAGTIGVLCAVLAREMGAARVFLLGLSDSHEVRFPVARQLGIDQCIDVSTTPAREAISRSGYADLPDLVIDATGNINGFNLALDLVKRNGRLVEVGSITQETPFSWEKAAYRAVDLLFVFSSSHRAWERAVALFNTSTVDFRKMITARYPLEDHADAFTRAANASQGLKTVFQL
jgi:L-iditol 2-dehydrogenase